MNDLRGPGGLVSEEGRERMREAQARRAQSEHAKGYVDHDDPRNPWGSMAETWARGDTPQAFDYQVNTQGRMGVAKKN